MRTLGIDLASRPKKTAACVIAWQADGADVTILRLGVSDADIIELAAQIGHAKARVGGDFAIGIDAPFGWPRPFVEFLSRSPASRQPLPPWSPDRANELKFRLTDRRVICDLGLWPLAVAADKIALPAMRCAGLLGALGVVDRSGVDGVFEVYPAAALKAWGLPFAGFGPGGADQQAAKAKLAAAFHQVRGACPWLKFATPQAESLCRANDDAFAALVASLAARAAAIGRTYRPRDEEQDRSRVEGWIAIPRSDCAIGGLLT